ncbi:ATP-grasp ribosomal peptide maturase [Streptomyces sp. MspMP-M5]|uniref:ATP-grasp ribosomal peptide maturase n=1 Tax=unclassified Streptomyces TaxID=2593676 RepID=UPI0003603027|nr:ATP-grasp ribosomal peptide maturase [Streptomyces sp. MspMP-M5]
MASPPVLAVTSLGDVTSDLVLDELYGRGVPVVRLDPGTDFTAGTTMAAHFGNHGPSGTLHTPSRRLDLSAVRSVYWRRPTPYGGATPATESAETRFAHSQARSGYGGTLAALPGALYLNHPWRNRDAEYKPTQLATAAQVGLDLPPTLLTNDPDAAKRFVARHAPAVYKPVHAVHLTPDSSGTPAHTIWVRTVEPDEIDDSVAACPHLFQACVPKVADIRLAAVGNRFFATRIDIDGDHLDWRQDYDVLAYTPVETPPAVRTAARAYLDAFGLVFGAFDFAVRDDGRWIWLETNPNGQWAFVDGPTRRKIATALADHLQRGSAR